MAASLETSPPPPPPTTTTTPPPPPPPTTTTTTTTTATTTSNNAASSGDGGVAEKAKTLIGALNLLSRNLPLPPTVLRAVSSIYLADAGDDSQVAAEPEAADGEAAAVEAEAMETDEVCGASSSGILMKEVEDAILKQQPNCMSYLELRNLKEDRFNSSIQHRLTELEVLPSSRGEELQMKCLLELYGLKLLELQKKVRSDISAEYWLHKKCTHPDKQLFDWGMMRLRYPFSMYGIGDSFAMDVNDRHRKKRYSERMSRLEEEEKNQAEMRKRKFFQEILNSCREFQQQAQNAYKRRKQRNDGVQTWHYKARQKITRAEKQRLQALKEGDQETYMRMLEESKNERLKQFLDETNQLLQGIGRAVQQQKDAQHVDRLEGIEPSKESKSDDPSQNNKSESTADRLLQTTVHTIKEKVTEQPSILEGGELRPYQLEGLQWMLSLFNNDQDGILADEMGLGKTIQTIALIAYLIEKKEVSGPHLIIAPKAVLPNWSNEFSTWAPSITAVLYDGRPEERKSLREEYFREGKFNVLLTHYDLIMKDKKFLKKVDWYYLIVDEGHRLKNHECALARTIVTGYNIRRRLLLTGTPIQNSLQELWSLLNFILPTIFNSVDSFEGWFNQPFLDDVSLTDEEQLLIIHRLHQVLRPFLLRRKKDEVEKYLPGKTQVILKCDMSAWQKAYYQQVTDMGRVGLESGIKSKSLQNLSMQLRKCCNHPYLFVGEYDIWRKEEIVRASGKFELLDRLLPKLQRSGHRVLLFSQMTRLMDILEIYLQLHQFKYLRLDGSTKTEERGSLLKRFNEPDSPFFMFLLSTRAGGLGLNLQTADTVIIFDSDWNPQMDQQAEDRAHRIGQKKEVRVFVLVSVGSIEEEILERAKQKMGIDAKVIQAGLFNTTSTAQDRRQMLQEIMRRGTSSLGTDVPSEREINRLAARNEQEFWLFEKMDEERRERESYKSRLVEENEVPDWVYPKTNENNIMPSVAEETKSNRVTGKRRRKEVVYADSLSDIQWMKAVEEGEDLSKLSARAKRATQSSDMQESDSFERRRRYRTDDNGDGANTPVRTPDKGKAGVSSHSKDDNDDDGEDEVSAGSLQDNVFAWRTTHKRRRSTTHVYSNSASDSKGRPPF